MMAPRGIDVGPQAANTVTLRESQRQRHRGPAPEKPSFKWNVQDKYIELLTFETEVTNIFETIAYELTDEEKVPIFKNWLGREGYNS